MGPPPSLLAATIKVVRAANCSTSPIQGRCLISMHSDGGFLKRPQLLNVLLYLTTLVNRAALGTADRSLSNVSCDHLDFQGL